MPNEREVEKFREEQIKLAKKIVIKDDFESTTIQRIAGVDQAYMGNKIISGIVSCDYKTMQPVEKVFAIVEAKIPYIPGYLSYREAPAIVEAFNKLEIKPDILMIDGHGIAHPRRFGMACHIGLMLDVPTIGIAKNLLVGEVKDGKIYVNGEVRGEEMLTKEFAKPLYISPGHRISIKTAVEIVKQCIRPPHKWPEPLWLAHRYADSIAKKEFKNNQRV